MKRGNRTKQLPYLTQYIEWAVDWRRGLGGGITPPMIISGVFISAAVGVIATALGGGIHSVGGGLFAGAITLFGYLLGAYGMSQKRSAREPGPARLKREAKQVAERLENIKDKKRLQRDLSTEVCSLLEEAARNWHRARTALDSPYWRRADLPTHIRSARDQSLLAVDQGMQEILVLFATSIPVKPGKWTWTEVVDEVVGQDMLTTRGRLDHLSPFYDEGRAVAGKLYEMAEQVETVSRRLAGEELIAGTPKPGSALEATLVELRELKQAEDELRQDLRS